MPPSARKGMCRTMLLNVSLAMLIPCDASDRACEKRSINDLTRLLTDSIIFAMASIGALAMSTRDVKTPLKMLLIPPHTALHAPMNVLDKYDIILL